ncbi:hypothetical protein [Actinomadura madurae]|uniref:hypothetical protein n=1 Tax=Actinomadura madurae TaxID=1993 RepID=UPI000D986A64|nr:hypothetical protein [Actinomadura madurae]SPT51025.1 Uncharacterised protein [Actinomadura madurae]
MRCPNCGTDTSSGSPTCTRCNAPLPPSGGGDATVRDPQGGGVPVPPPWTLQWGAQADHTTPMPPSEERTTHLSPEPWAEPAIWQPPAPPKRGRLPYFLGAAGVVLLIGLALAIVFWPSGSETTPPTASEPSAQQSQSAPSETGSTEGDFDAQAKAVDTLLDEMGSTRSDLGTVVVGGCSRGGLQRILNARQGQLDEARNLQVNALDSGEQLKDALVRALEASTESNQRYLDVAPGCPSEGEVSDINRRASDAKTEFIGYWAPVAEKAGLPARTESDI